MSESESQSSQEIRFTGVAASPGVVTAPIIVFASDEKIVRRRKIKEEDISRELGIFEEALGQTRKEILEIKERLSADIMEKDAEIFEAHLLVLDDPTIIEAVKTQLEEKLLSVDYLYQQTTKSFVQQLRKIDDEYLSERASDIQDVSRRVLRHMQGRGGGRIYQLDSPSIILAHDLTPSDTAQMDRSMVLGFATEVGSRTSHTAIMARSLNIPAVVSLRNVIGKIESGCEALLDGHEGILILNPTDQTKWLYGQIEGKRLEVDTRLESLRESIAITSDQRRLIVSANVGLDEDLPLLKENGAEGVGLYRTEFLFLNREEFPSEEEQYQKYLQVAQTAKPHSIIIRTLDIGGDKMATNGEITPEANPFLGWRGIRFCLDRVEIFKTQLRAICRASAEGNVRVMFPMVSDISEFRRAKDLFWEVYNDLKNNGVPVGEKIDCGVMIEVPSAAMTADAFAKEADFLSIGTNDLIQYTLAVDRVNERVANLYQPTHPSILRLIHRVVEAGHQEKIWVGVCGEMAGDILMTPMLVGLGVDELSLGSVFVPRIKKAIQTMNYEETRALAQGWMQSGSSAEIAKALEEFARRLYPDLL